jgi:ABC-type microcin C transport system permease subunit YejE
MSDATESLSLSQRAWLTFKADRRAYGGLILAVVLYYIAILAPLLADSKPLMMHNGRGWSFPLFRSLTVTDWRYLLYGLGSTLIFAFRRRWSFSHG